MIDDAHASRCRILVGSVNQNVDEGFHAVHVLRIFHRGHLHNPARRLHLLQMKQEIVKVRDWKLLERDVKRGLALRLQFTR